MKGARFGDFRDVGHPVTLARMYDAQGADELIFLDIQATGEDRETLFGIVAATAEQCFMPLTVGGGVRTVEDIRRLLRAGADKVAINTAALERPALIGEGAERFGSQCIVVSIDYRVREDGFHEVCTYSGQRATGIEARAWASQAVKHGAGELLLTSIDKDGTRLGYDLPFLRAVADAVPVPVIAAGGVGSLQHLVDGVVAGHASAVSAGSLFYFTDQSIIKARSFMRVAGLDVRLA